MITGSHTIIYTKDADADRRFLKDVLKLPSVDVGEGWLIFGLPPSEVAFHPFEKNDEHEFYLICEDVEALVRTLKQRDVVCSEVTNEGWGLLTQITLPAGGTIGVYEPRHARPKSVSAAPRTAKKAGQAAKKVKTKKAAKKVAKKATKKKAKRR